MGLLAVGAGAGKGLDQYLAQMLAEQHQAEIERSNQADEKLKGRAIDSASADRASARSDREAAQQDAAKNRAAQQENTLVDNVRATLPMRQPGAVVDQTQHDFEVKHGADPTLYDQKSVPDKQAVASGVPESLAQNDPVSSFLFKGTRTNTPETSAEVKTVKISDPALAKSLGKKVGDPIDADYNPKTKTYTHRGVDVTNGTDHYEKPPAPDRVLVPTDMGFRPRADVTADVKGGKQVNPQEPAQVRNREDMATKVGSHFADTQTLLDEAEQKGLLGPLKGRTFTEFLAGKVGSTGNTENDALLGELREDLQMLRSGVATLHGRAGANAGIAKEIEKRMDEGHMSYAEVNGAMKGLKKWVDEYATKPGLASSTAAPPATPHRQYDPATGTIK